jgi:hypothetical protein
MVLFHKEFRVSPTIAGKSMFRNKIPETLKPGCLCTGMKTRGHDYELHLGGTAKPGFQLTSLLLTRRLSINVTGNLEETVSAFLSGGLTCCPEFSPSLSSVDDLPERFARPH